MQRQTNDPKSLSGTAGVSEVGRRRGRRPVPGGQRSRWPAQEPAAAAKQRPWPLNGGPKAVTAPTGNATRWPLYGEEEEKAVLALVRQRPTTRPIARIGEGVEGILQGSLLPRPTATAPAR